MARSRSSVALFTAICCLLFLTSRLHRFASETSIALVPYQQGRDSCSLLGNCAPVANNEASNLDVSQADDHHVKNESTLLEPSTRHSHAYVFLLAGCDPDKPSYRGFLLNVLVATDFLVRRLEVHADVVVLVRMSHSSQHERLPQSEEGWLQDVGAQIQYLPQPTEKETFHQLQLLKFHVLDLVQYRRVLYLDSDILPTCSLDYGFQLSEEGVLRENLVIAWTKEPANGGFFLLEPYEGARADLQEIVDRQRRDSQSLPLPHFDKIKGWGHEISVDDEWMSLQRRLSGHKWSFYASWSDQGLLYHYVKYFRRSVSIVLGKAVQNWMPGPTGTVVLQHELDNPFVNYTCSSRKRYLRHPGQGDVVTGLPLYKDFVHFYSVFKPWVGEAAETIEAEGQAKDVRQFWFYLLRTLNERLQMEIPLDDRQEWKNYMQVIEGGNLNRVPSLADLAKANRSIHDF